MFASDYISERETNKKVQVRHVQRQRVKLKQGAHVPTRGRFEQRSLTVASLPRVQVSRRRWNPIETGRHRPSVAGGGAVSEEAGLDEQEKAKARRRSAQSSQGRL